MSTIWVLDRKPILVESNRHVAYQCDIGWSGKIGLASSIYPGIRQCPHWKSKEEIWQYGCGHYVCRSCRNDPDLGFKPYEMGMVCPTCKKYHTIGVYKPPVPDPSMECASFHYSGHICTNVWRYACGHGACSSCRPMTEVSNYFMPRGPICANCYHTDSKRFPKHIIASTVMAIISERS